MVSLFTISFRSFQSTELTPLVAATAAPESTLEIQIRDISTCFNTSRDTGTDSRGRKNADLLPDLTNPAVRPVLQAWLDARQRYGNDTASMNEMSPRIQNIASDDVRESLGNLPASFNRIWHRMVNEVSQAQQTAGTVSPTATGGETGRGAGEHGTHDLGLTRDRSATPPAAVFHAQSRVDAPSLSKEAREQMRRTRQVMAAREAGLRKAAENRKWHRKREEDEEKKEEERK